ncbi:15627_t:CDS:2 [Funneliformis geosporum]|uniref:15627_t:CDS:1 n=1 Tax=Funneliformis geosporum TaxID=1117311 RepID=A0A9W4SB09_9GLOM|nr:15627_t:CDS:2 [Funneliformis geosporum]
MVLGMDVSAEISETEELAEDLLSIVTVFVARHNGMPYPSLSYARREIETQTLDGNSTMDLQSVSRSSRKRGYHANKKALRVQYLNATNFNNTELKWALETPYDIRDEGMNDLLKAYSTNFAAKQTKFKIKFRSKKDRQQSIAVLSKH